MRRLIASEALALAMFVVSAAPLAQALSIDSRVKAVSMLSEVAV